MPTIDLGQVVGPAGKSAYQYAVDGGYTGTEAEFGALLADAASKTYVDTLFNRVAPVIVTVQVTRGSGSGATVILESPSAGGIILFGIIMSDGYVWFPSADSDFYDTYTITGSFTLEVA